MYPTVRQISTPVYFKIITKRVISVVNFNYEIVSDWNRIIKSTYETKTIDTRK